MQARKLLLITAGLAAVAGCGQKPAPAAEAPVESTVTPDANSPSVSVSQIRQMNLSGDVDATGRLVVREEAAVGVELSGFRVAEVYADEGDWVEKGQPLARLDGTLLQAQIAQAEATMATQKATADFKKSQYERGAVLAEEGAFSKEQLEQRRMDYEIADATLQAAAASLNEMRVRESRLTIRAPVAGSVLQRSIRPGEISSIATASPYFRIARDGLVELDAEVSEEHLADLKVGEPAKVGLATGETFDGKVRFISPRVDAATSLGRVRIALPYNPSLRAGSFAEAHMEGVAKDAIAVAASAVRYESGGAAVMVVDASNKVRRVPVKLGAHVGGLIEIVEGPPAGSRVLTIGTAYVLDGDTVNPVAAKGEPDGDRLVSETGDR
ncbi:MAG: efflux RND transporter periplasmic adaptor subunit [Hyphomonadaceae bacterium]